MTSWYNWVTFDMIGDLAVGEPFGCVDNAHDPPWVKLIFKHIKGMAIATALIRYPFADSLAALLTPKNVINDIKNHWEFTEAQQISHKETLANAHNLIVGGSETTTTALSGTTYLLATNRRILRKLQDELRANFNSEDEIDFLSVQKPDYMMAVLHETLLIYPPVPSAIPRKAPPNGTTIRGEYIPPDTILQIWQWPMFHNPKLFKDPERLIPERWLGDPEFASDRLEAAQPFSVGPRNCIGKKFVS
ncbi:putative cytochrome p450 protein [Phaeoacremonium minimum UCRPA7]|uniref:Putative cytochrome p450 protein n=1 Tax=Phaeoacremonium minimum (strain UCR-PA7) TaxID=1286976 RepID=R8BK26_PHAM7|nr:putative cytochrome p450 protein [Phaeoacremonium minimum UCRPA7]EON99670.1 putative cytochrome p450 protein [Phaeoacremonium minimum UCRPA7]